MERVGILCYYTMVTNSSLFPSWQTKTLTIDVSDAFGEYMHILFKKLAKLIHGFFQPNCYWYPKNPYDMNQAIYPIKAEANVTGRARNIIFRGSAFFARIPPTIPTITKVVRHAGGID